MSTPSTSSFSSTNSTTKFRTPPSPPPLPPLPPRLAPVPTAAVSPTATRPPPSPRSPRPPNLPKYGSTSTISRSSSSHRASNDGLLEPLSIGRIPKARVFVRRTRPATTANLAPLPPVRVVERQLPPRQIAPRSFSVMEEDDVPYQNKTRSQPRDRRHHYRGRDVVVQREHRSPKASRRDARCQSDLQDMFRAPKRIPTPAPADWAKTRVKTPVQDEVPSWIPRDEMRDWTVSMPRERDRERDRDPCDEEWSSRWMSLRAFRKEAPSIRGSVLEIQPPTIGERLGITGGYTGRKGRRFGMTNRSPKVKEEAVDAFGRDDYVGFIADEEREFALPRKKGFLWRLRRNQCY